MLHELLNIAIMLAVVGIPFVTINIIIEKIKDHHAR
jgi:hypothetical protein